MTASERNVRCLGEAATVMAMLNGTRRLLITDPDNTVWNWFQPWFESFFALVDGLVAISGANRGVLEEPIKGHRRHSDRQLD